MRPNSHNNYLKAAYQQAQIIKQEDDSIFSSQHGQRGPEGIKATACISSVAPIDRRESNASESQDVFKPNTQSGGWCILFLADSIGFGSWSSGIESVGSSG
jgi:hypothetical protein